MGVIHCSECLAIMKGNYGEGLASFMMNVAIAHLVLRAQRGNGSRGRTHAAGAYAQTGIVGAAATTWTNTTVLAAAACMDNTDIMGAAAAPMAVGAFTTAGTLSVGLSDEYRVCRSTCDWETTLGILVAKNKRMNMWFRYNHWETT